MWRTPEFEVFVRPAHARSAMWQVAVAIFVGLFVWVIGAMLLLVGIGLLFPELVPSQEGTGNPFKGIAEDLIPAAERGQTPIASALMLAIFVPFLVSLWVMARFHGRPFGSFFGRRRGFKKYFFGAFAITLAINLIFYAFEGAIEPQPLVQHHSTPIWLVVIALTAPLLLVQVITEELFFRGYLSQQLGVWFSHPNMWMFLPSLLFAAAHFGAEGGSNDIVIWAFFFGLVATDLTRLTGNIAAAMGLHFTNNATVLYGVGHPDVLGGLALFHTAPTSGGWVLWVDLLYLFISWAALRIWLNGSRLHFRPPAQS